MNKTTSLMILLTVFALAMTGCSITDPITQETTPVNTMTIANGGAGETDPTDTIKLANGGSGESGKINDVPIVTPQEQRDPVPVTVPRVTQSEVIGVVRELRANGCIIQKVATTDGIHYSQLLVTCGEPQTPPVQ